MNLFELFVKLGVDDQASDKVSSFSEKLGKGLKTAAKVGTVAVTAAASAITALTAAAVNNYAEYEQLVGGVETLFKDSADVVQTYASNAYKTAGLSANEYMTTVTSFSASLLQSLGGDTQAAAEYADMAITDMADNANKMGSSIETLQTAYAGFAKQNYTMLDNLKLGYGGTKEEMQRLLDDAEKLPGALGRDFDISNYADVVEAIHLVQDEMGITGTTAKEASETIAGSLASTKAAWDNLLTGIADENANFGELINNFVDSAATALDNLLPRIEESLYGIDALIYRLVPIILEKIPELINEFLPSLTYTATMILQTLLDSVSENQEMIFNMAFDIITFLVESFIGMLPDIIALGLNLIISLANGISESLPELIPTVIDVIFQIVDTLTDPKNLESFLNASLEIIMAIADGIVEFLPKLIEAAVTLIERLIVFLLEPENLQKLGQAAVDIVVALAEGLIKSVGTLIEATGKLIQNVADKIEETDWKELGKNIVDGIWNGLKSTWTSLKKWFTDAWDSLVAGVKDLLGIHSPSLVFAGIGKNMALGVGEGWESKFKAIKKNIDKSLHFDDASIAIDGSVKKTGGVFGNGAAGVSVVQNIYSQAKTAADLMQEALYQQKRAVILGV